MSLTYNQIRENGSTKETIRYIWLSFLSTDGSSYIFVFYSNLKWI